MNNEWEYYNHALVPTLPPHIDPDISWMKGFGQMERICRRKDAAVCQMGVGFRLLRGD